MPFVLREDGVAVHIYADPDLTAPKICHCFDGDIESEVEVEIDLDIGLITGYGPGSKAPTGDFLWEALRVFRKNKDSLWDAWYGINM